VGQFVVDPTEHVTVSQKSCASLCRDAFGLDGSVEVRSCTISKVDAANAHVTVRFYDGQSLLERYRQQLLRRR